MDCFIVKRLLSSFTEADIKEYLYRENLFKEGNPNSKIDFETFKKAYFPHLFHILDDN